MSSQFAPQRRSAQRRLLNRLDILNWDDAPDYVIDAIFDTHCSYRNRHIVTIFCYLNAIQKYQMNEIVRWRDYTASKRRKVDQLWVDCEREPYRSQWYGYCTLDRRVCYLNGKYKYEKF